MGGWSALYNTGKALAKAPFQVAGKAIGAYGHTLTNLNYRKPVQRLVGATMVGAPIAAAANIAYQWDKPNQGHVMDYGDMISQHTMFGKMPADQLNSYDMNRGMEAAQRNGIAKAASFNDLIRISGLMKTAGIFGSIGPAINGIRAAGTSGITKAPLFQHLVGSKSPFSFGNIAMTGGGLGMIAHSDIALGGQQMKQNMTNITSGQNIPRL